MKSLWSIVHDPPAAKLDDAGHNFVVWELDGSLETNDKDITEEQHQ